MTLLCDAVPICVNRMRIQREGIARAPRRSIVENKLNGRVVPIHDHNDDLRAIGRERREGLEAPIRLPLGIATVTGRVQRVGQPDAYGAREQVA